MEKYDVIVIGASNSGAMAAAAAAEKGAKVLLVDKSKSTKFLFRNTIASVGSNAQKKKNLHINKSDLVNFIAAFAQGNVDRRLLWTWVNNSAETVNWIDDNVLRPHGAYMDATTDAKYKSIQNTAFPTGNEVTNAEGTYWQMGWANGYSTSLKN
ncbi:FAD-binding protein [Lactobacillus helveticus]|uniref:FAD-binding protein n=1 Tax=Lactobacillus helveticus TaxID=1587 RepID=UPI001C6510D4|nr:FAD-binding protein [Lactobacillus helveticus]MBW8014121.1 FAD-binding protein [Lactobacillus helveticus]